MYKGPWLDVVFNQDEAAVRQLVLCSQKSLRSLSEGTFDSQEVPWLSSAAVTERRKWQGNVMGGRNGDSPAACYIAGFPESAQAPQGLGR